MQNEVLRESYATLIHNYPWDFYITQTYRTTRRDGIINPLRFWHILNSKFGSSRCFVAVEHHKLDGIHLHALSRHTWNPNVSPSHIWKYLFKTYGRVRVEAPRHSSTALVTWYCSKYLVKDGFEYHFFGYPEAWTGDNLTKGV